MRRLILLAIAIALPAHAQFTPPSGVGGTCGALGGDVSGTCAANTVNKINGTALSGLATGILKNTTTTGVPSIAVGSDVCGLLTLTGPITSTACATAIANSINLPGSPTTTTQATGDSSTSIATDAYVAAALASLNPAVSVQAATIAVLSNTPTYANGTAGVGATLTAGSNGALTIDGYVVLLNDRILVKNQASSFQNGVYTQTTLGTGGVPYVLTRATDYNSSTNINYTGTIPVLQGSTLSNTGWNLTTQVNVIGTDAISYTQASGTAAGPAGGNVKATGALTSGDVITGAGGKSIQDSNVTIANVRARTFGYSFGDSAGAALTAGSVAYFSLPFSCTIASWDISVDAGTVTFDIWKIATGSANPTVSNKITASAKPALSTGTHLHSTSMSGWTTSVAVNDIFGIDLDTVATAKFASINLECDQ